MYDLNLKRVFTVDLQRVKSDAAAGNSPLWFGEWALPTQFNATDDFLFRWADAQKLMYSQGAGWIVRDLYYTAILSKRELIPSLLLPAVLELQSRGI